jgi:hypothetical protein
MSALDRESVSIGVWLGVCSTVITAFGALALLSPPAPEPRPCPDIARVVTRHVVHEVPVHADSPMDCALLAMARIASAEGATIGRGRWAVAVTIGEIAQDCEEATALVALTRQESTWDPSAVSHAGACGVTQVRSCDAPGTWESMPCCDEYRAGGHHCRPTCAWLQVPEHAIGWTAAWLRDRDGWDPTRYVGARDPAVGAGYVARAEGWRRLAQGDE